jgi:hypothetical protein
VLKGQSLGIQEDWHVSSMRGRMAVIAVTGERGALFLQFSSNVVSIQHLLLNCHRAIIQAHVTLKKVEGTRSQQET